MKRKHNLDILAQEMIHSMENSKNKHGLVMTLRKHLTPFFGTSLIRCNLELTFLNSRETLSPPVMTQWSIFP